MPVGLDVRAPYEVLRIRTVPDDPSPTAPGAPCYFYLAISGIDLVPPRREPINACRCPSPRAPPKIAAVAACGQRGVTRAAAAPAPARRSKPNPIATANSPFVSPLASQAGGAGVMARGREKQLPPPVAGERVVVSERAGGVAIGRAGGVLK